MKESIIITEPASPIGGINSVVDNLRPFFHYNVITAYRGPKDGKRGVKYHNKFSSFFLPILDIIRYTFTILIYRPKFVIVNSSVNTRSIIRDTYYVKVATRLGCKVLLFEHGFEYSAYEASQKQLMECINQADHILALSGFYKDLLMKITKIPVSVIYNPVDDNFRRTFNDEYVDNKLYDSPINILFISRIIKEKGIYIAINSFQSIQAEFPGARLHIAGNGKDLKEVMEYVANKGIKGVTFYGSVVGIQKVNLFKQSQVLLFPSLSEGLPVSVLEAMQAGLAVVTTSVGGTVDMYDSIKFGEMIRPGSEDDCEAALLKILSQDLRPIGLRNHNYAETYFSPKVIVSQIETILNSL